MNIKISDAELEVMRILWREGRAISYADIRKELERTTAWNKSTIQTLVGRLRDKGIISTTAGEPHTLYSAAISMDEHNAAEGERFIDKLFGGSAKNLVSELCKSGKLNPADIKELHEFWGDGK